MRRPDPPRDRPLQAASPACPAEPGAGRASGRAALRRQSRNVPSNPYNSSVRRRDIAQCPLIYALVIDFIFQAALRALHRERLIECVVAPPRQRLAAAANTPDRTGRIADYQVKI